MAIDIRIFHDFPFEHGDVPCLCFCLPDGNVGKTMMKQPQLHLFHMWYISTIPSHGWFMTFFDSLLGLFPDPKPSRMLHVWNIHVHLS